VPFRRFLGADASPNAPDDCVKMALRAHPASSRRVPPRFRRLVLAFHALPTEEGRKKGRNKLRKKDLFSVKAAAPQEPRFSPAPRHWGEERRRTAFFVRQKAAQKLPVH
jgi:hypothetical protein